MTDTTKNENPKQRDADVRVPLSLMPPVAMIHIAAVLRSGASKPGRWQYNWRDNPIKLSTYLDAQLRHLLAVHDGEWLDPESGCPHVAHMAANNAILLDAEAAGTLVKDTPEVPTGVRELLEKYSSQYKAALEEDVDIQASSPCCKGCGLPDFMEPSVQKRSDGVLRCNDCEKHRPPCPK